MVTHYDQRCALVVNNIILETYGIFPDQLKSQNRSAEVVHAKFIAWHLLNKYFQMPFLRIASIYMKDHTTIMNGVRVVENSLNWRLESERIFLRKLSKNKT